MRGSGRRGARSIGLAGCAAGGLLALVLTAYAWHVGAHLLEAASPEPDRLDAVFTFDGNAARLTRSRELARRFGARWIVSDSEDRLDARGLLAVDDPEIGARLIGAHSTWMELLALRRELATRGHAVRDVALVSDAHHLRRIRLAAGRALRDTPYRLHFLAPPARSGRGDRWWAEPRLRREVLKNVYYALGGYLLPIGRDS